MGRSRDGQILERRWKHGRGYALRFIAYGQRRYLTLGNENDGWTRKRAEQELANVMADVRRGTWIPPDRNRTPARGTSNEAPEVEPTFHMFASQWFADRQGEISPATHRYDYWALAYHLLPYFATWRLSEITIEAVDDYRRYKTTQAHQRRYAIDHGQPLLSDDGRVLRPLSAGSINKTIDVLQVVLALAVEYGHMTANPASGRRRRLKPPVRRPVHVDSAQHLQALLDAASDLDANSRWLSSDRRAIVSTLLLAGPRAHELCHLRWRDVDLANARIHIGLSKTRAGLREIPLLPLLRDDLAAHKARAANPCPDDLVFPTNTGGLRDKDNLRNRVLAATIVRADELLAQQDHPPLPTGLTPHKLRHTFASILVATGEDPASVMAQLGHTDPKFTLRVYTHLMRREPGERARLRSLVNGDPGDPTPDIRRPVRVVDAH